MSEKKVVRRSVVVGLGIVCILLIAGLGGAMAYYISTHHHADSDYDSLNNIVDLANSTVWVNDTTVTQTAGDCTIWLFSANYAGYVSVNVQTSTTDTTYVELFYYAYMGIHYDNTITVGTNGTVAFPILPPISSRASSIPISSIPINVPRGIEIRVGNTNTVGNATEIVTITYYY